MKSKRVIVDTNIWISFLITNNYSIIDKLIEEKKIQLIFSNELIEEFVRVASRTKFKSFFSTSQITRLLDLFDVYGKLLKVKSDIKVCLDHSDDFLLSLAYDSKADFLITGDADLLDIKNFYNTRILTFREFIDEISPIKLENYHE
jgi:putative PIN family toxin of toxin-antitoxin system